jgi:hypothetical protein
MSALRAKGDICQIRMEFQLSSQADITGHWSPPTLLLGKTAVREIAANLAKVGNTALAALEKGTMTRRLRKVISVTRSALMALFWIWGGFGLVGNLLSLNSQIGLAALSSQLLWIGGMLLFGLGALLLAPAVKIPSDQ